MSRKVMTAWFAIVGIPLLVATGWLISRTESAGRGVLILDVPADVDVVIDGRLLKPCLHEYRAPSSCKLSAPAGFSRRYSWSVIRGGTVVVNASRGPLRAPPRTVPIAREGPTPHLRLDDRSFDWVDVGGVRHDDGVTVFVDHDGHVVGPVGPSEPD